jgi:hypothetical protein
MPVFSLAIWSIRLENKRLIAKINTERKPGNSKMKAAWKLGEGKKNWHVETESSHD